MVPVSAVFYISTIVLIVFYLFFVFVFFFSNFFLFSFLLFFLSFSVVLSLFDVFNFSFDFDINGLVSMCLTSLNSFATL